MLVKHYKELFEMKSIVALTSTMNLELVFY